MQTVICQYLIFLKNFFNVLFNILNYLDCNLSFRNYINSSGTEIIVMYIYCITQCICIALRNYSKDDYFLNVIKRDLWLITPEIVKNVYLWFVYVNYPRVILLTFKYKNNLWVLNQVMIYYALISVLDFKILIWILQSFFSTLSNLYRTLIKVLWGLS